MENESKALIQGQRIKYTRIDCPFDLEQVLQISYSSTGLKSVLEFILDTCSETRAEALALDGVISGMHKDPIVSLDCACKDAGSCTCKRHPGVALPDHKDLSKIVAELEEKSEVMDNEHRDHVQTYSEEQMNNGLERAANRERLNTLEKNEVPSIWEAIKALQDVKPPAPVIQAVEGAAFDPNSLADIYAGKQAPDRTIFRIEALEQEMKDMMAKMDANQSGLDGRVAKLEAFEKKSEQRFTYVEEDIEKLKKKLQHLIDNMGKGPTGEVDTSAIMIQIASMKEEISNCATKTDLNELRIELKSYTDQGLKTLQDDLKKALEALKFDVERNHAEFCTHATGVFADIVKRVTILEKMIKELASRPREQHHAPSNDNDAELKRLAELLAMLQGDLQGLKNEVSAGFTQIQNDLDRKADRDELKDLEARFLDQINELVKTISKKFADKAQNKKEHQDMERQIRNLYDIIMSKGGQQNEDDAMFTKKPFAGLSCASCEKDIINMYGKRVEFMPWGKMPFRDPSERIARVGQGFSKMLSMLKPDSLSRYDGSKMPPEMMQQSQNQGGSEMYHGGQEAQRKTHSRFPNANRLAHTTDGKRPGSAQAVNKTGHMNKRNTRGQQQ